MVAVRFFDTTRLIFVMELRKAPKVSQTLGIPRISITQVWWNDGELQFTYPVCRGLPNLGQWRENAFHVFDATRWTSLYRR